MTSADLTPAAPMNSIIVQFNDNCVHQGAKMNQSGREFWLGFAPQDRRTDFQAFMKNKFSRDECDQFKTTSTKIGQDPWTWKAVMKIPPKKSGWLMLYSATGGFAGFGQTCRRVVLWWVQQSGRIAAAETGVVFKPCFPSLIGIFNVRDAAGKPGSASDACFSSLAGALIVMTDSCFMVDMIFITDLSSIAVLRNKTNAVRIRPSSILTAPPDPLMLTRSITDMSMCPSLSVHFPFP